MAIYHFHTKIVSASKGKCAVAASAYISGTELYDERLGQWFSYTNKEEVLYHEVLLPENAPEEFYDREILWNEVESAQNKSNSRYARQFDMALPNELSDSEWYYIAREFVQENFVDLGMAADFAIHNKEGNPHVHVMCTVRGFNEDGTWATMEKKVYALDENGNRIPEIDQKNGKQKVRVRKGKGEEKLWKRETVQTNNWNSREQLLKWRRNWAKACNEYLSKDKWIDHRSYEKQGIDKIPTIHEGYAAREMEERGMESERVTENILRKEQNELTERLRDFVNECIAHIRSVSQILEEYGNEKYKNRFRNRSSRGVNRNRRNVSRDDSGLAVRECTSGSRKRTVKAEEQQFNKRKLSIKEQIAARNAYKEVKEEQLRAFYEKHPELELLMKQRKKHRNRDLEL